MFQVDGGNALREETQMYKQPPDVVLDDVATALGCLRTSGYEPFASISLKLADSRKNPSLGAAMIRFYTRYLVAPFDTNLGGFVNYELDDIWAMSFLRVVPFGHQDLRSIKESLFQSPAARMLLQKKEMKINVFVEDRPTQRSLEATLALSERYPEIHQYMANYRKKIAQGDIVAAVKESDNASSVLREQYSKEVEDWNRT